MKVTSNIVGSTPFQPFEIHIAVGDRTEAANLLRAMNQISYQHSGDPIGVMAKEVSAEIRKHLN